MPIFFSVAHPCASAQYIDYPNTIGQTRELTLHQLPAWLRFDVATRGRTEVQSAFNNSSGDVRPYELTRVWGGMQIKPRPWMDIYTQFEDSHALGLPLKYTAGNMRDTFDLRQAFLSLHLEKAGVIVGRQRLKFGDERLVGISDWTNVSRTFDGIDVHFGTKNRVDIFSATVVDIYPTSLDKENGGLNFHGVYGSFKHVLPKATIEPYVFIRNQSNVVSKQKIVGDKLETTFGVHLSDDIPGDLDYDLEGNLQRGSYSNNSIHAGSGYAKLRYTFDYLPWKPALQGEYDYATGDSHQDPQRISTYDQLYPSDHNVFGLTDLFGWQNIKQARGNLYLTPMPNLTALIQGETISLASKNDNIYSGSGQVFLAAPANGFSSGNIGTGIDFSLKYAYHKYLIFNAGIGHIFPGTALREVPNSAATTISFIGMTYRFRVSKNSNLPPDSTDK